MIYFFRHQAHGVMWECPFTEPPTDAQLAPLRHAMFVRHGLQHPKTHKPWWDRVVEVRTWGPGEVPAAPDSGGPAGPVKGAGKGELEGLEAKGEGHVENP